MIETYKLRLYQLDEKHTIHPHQYHFQCQVHLAFFVKTRKLGEIGQLVKRILQQRCRLTIIFTTGNNRPSILFLLLQTDNIEQLVVKTLVQCIFVIIWLFEQKIRAKHFTDALDANRMFCFVERKASIYQFVKYSLYCRLHFFLIECVCLRLPHGRCLHSVVLLDEFIGGDKFTYHQSLKDIPVVAIGNNKIFYFVVFSWKFIKIIGNNFMKGFTVEVFVINHLRIVRLRVLALYQHLGCWVLTVFCKYAQVGVILIFFANVMLAFVKCLNEEISNMRFHHFLWEVSYLVSRLNILLQGFYKPCILFILQCHRIQVYAFQCVLYR